MKLAYLNINGVFYKSTKNKLQRQLVPPASASLPYATKPSPTTTTTTSSRPAYGTNGGVRSIFVRGTKYSVSADFKRLQRNRTDPANPAAAASSGMDSSASGGSNGSRLDIGGVTFVQVAPGTFERTDGHRTRDHLSAARQKSINLLLAAGSRTKSNLPCLIYQRLGKCRALERGRCPRVHDAKRVAICPKSVSASIMNRNCKH